jgi:hypothetical protein
MLMHVLRHFLLLVALFGLVGQGIAQASGPCAAMAQAQNASMADMADCMMGEHQSDDDNAPVPCKGMTPGCVAMAGCTAAVALDFPAAAFDEPVIITLAATWPAVAALNGLDIAPDPDPPALLG